MINYSKIKRIKILDEFANTYTLSVNDELHQFVADGVITQNSGGEAGAKRVALLHTNSILSHGAVNFLADTRRVRSQKNDDYWAAFMRGYQPPEPEQPAMYHKFIAHLEGAGIHVTPQLGRLKILALTNNDVKELAGNREVTTSETRKWEGDQKGIKGGLFDAAIFGEYEDRWGYIKPTQPMLNPVMEEPARRMLGLTQAKLENVIAGRESIGDYGTGPKAVKKALASLNVDAELAKARAVIANGKGTARDEAVKKLQFLKSAKDNGLNPADWVLDRLPVLPSKFRPISEMSGSKTLLVSDVNYLYKQFIDHNDSVKELEQQVGDAGEEYLQSYNYFKQITGLMDPTHPKLKQKRVEGLLKSVFGSGGSKYGMVQRSLLGGGVDNIARNVVVVDPNLDMDAVGIPINSAYEVYKPIVLRKLVQSGVPLLQAQDMFDNKDRRAKKALLQATKERPVVVDRSPILHKGGIMAFWPKLVKGDAIKMSQYVAPYLAYDTDGDQMNFQVPISADAVEDAKRLMLPSQNLLSPLNNSPMATPQEEYIAGLFEATRLRKKKGRAKVFATKEDMKKAFNSGDISISDEVEILKR
jgi:DNA-directed RNA polymerase beta' subunit